MRYSPIFRGTKFKPFNKKVFGFDIETYNNNKSFYCVSIYGDNYRNTFFNKKDFIDEIKKHRFRNSILVASNLLFDFFGIFFGDDTVRKFMTLFRGSDLLYAKTYTRNNEFHRLPSSRERHNLLFLDTLNYASMSVENLGKLINLPKLKTPKFIGKKPQGEKQENEMIAYNMRDSEISQKALLFLYESFSNLGANPKKTIASTSMSLFRNKYLTEGYFQHKKKDLLSIFKSYYGGRTEAFARGLIGHQTNNGKPIYYYDINSLYPFVMENKEYPNPNTLRVSFKNTVAFLEQYEGFSDVRILSPNFMQYPLLPLRTKEKLLFPLGEFRGFYSNVELREAIKLGYVVKKVFKSVYFLETCRPFQDFVNDLYKKRLEYKELKSPMEYVTKILLNSLYGKFGERFDNKDNWIPIPDNHDAFEKLNVINIIGDYVRVRGSSKPAVHCFPEWASYVSSYGRLELYKLITQCQPLYCDTDSVMTTKKMRTGNKLGELKLEMNIHQGVLVKPKLYCIKGDTGQFVKAKGVGIRFDYETFRHEFLLNPKVHYKKFIKFKEALRRGFQPNEIIEMHKDLSLEDNKRKWKNKFNPNLLEWSFPREMETKRRYPQLQTPRRLQYPLIPKRIE